VKREPFFNEIRPAGRPVVMRRFRRITAPWRP
jgi:hypothetical protein